jgi:hypothetical protein
MPLLTLNFQPCLGTYAEFLAMPWYLRWVSSYALVLTLSFQPCLGTYAEFPAMPLLTLDFQSCLQSCHGTYAEFPAMPLLTLSFQSCLYLRWISSHAFTYAEFPAMPWYLHWVSSLIQIFSAVFSHHKIWSSFCHYGIFTFWIPDELHFVTSWISLASCTKVMNIIIGSQGDPYFCTRAGFFQVPNVEIKLFPYCSSKPRKCCATIIVLDCYIF